MAVEPSNLYGRGFLEAIMLVLKAFKSRDWKCIDQEVDFKNSKIIDVSMINENSVEKKINQLSNKIFKRFNELIWIVFKVDY